MSDKSELIKILEELSDYKARLSGESIKIFIERLQKISINPSEKYSKILGFVKESSSIKNFDLAILNENLQTIIENSDDPRLIENLGKIYDYLKMEFQREERFKAFEKIAEDIQKETREETARLIAKIDSTGKNIEKIQDEVKQSQTQYITILGIFASIVLAFVGGLTFSTSVLSHMHEVSIYRLVFVICCIGFLIFNTLFALFGFILRITEKEVDYCVFRVVNGIFVAILIINALHYSIYGKEDKQSPKQEVNLSIQAKTK